MSYFYLPAAIAAQKRAQRRRFMVECWMSFVFKVTGFYRKNAHPLLLARERLDLYELSVSGCGRRTRFFGMQQKIPRKSYFAQSMGKQTWCTYFWHFYLLLDQKITPDEIRRRLIYFFKKELIYITKKLTALSCWLCYCQEKLKFFHNLTQSNLKIFNWSSEGSLYEGVSNPLCLSSSSAVIFSDYSFWAHYPVNQLTDYVFIT
jgi:hypothetical protein